MQRISVQPLRPPASSHTDFTTGCALLGHDLLDHVVSSLRKIWAPRPQSTCHLDTSMKLHMALNKLLKPHVAVLQLSHSCLWELVYEGLKCVFFSWSVLLGCTQPLRGARTMSAKKSQATSNCRAATIKPLGSSCAMLFGRSPNWAASKVSLMLLSESL